MTTHELSAESLANLRAAADEKAGVDKVELVGRHRETHRGLVELLPADLIALVGQSGTTNEGLIKASKALEGSTDPVSIEAKDLRAMLELIDRKNAKAPAPVNDTPAPLGSSFS